MASSLMKVLPTNGFRLERQQCPPFPELRYQHQRIGRATWRISNSLGEIVSPDKKVAFWSNIGFGAISEQQKE